MNWPTDDRPFTSIERLALVHLRIAQHSALPYQLNRSVYMDIIALEDTADVRFIRATAIASELFNRSWLIAKGFKEGKRESRWVKGRFG